MSYNAAPRGPNAQMFALATVIIAKTCTDPEKISRHVLDHMGPPFPRAVRRWAERPSWGVWRAWGGCCGGVVRAGAGGAWC
jgi:hypothetical protein